MSQPTVGRIDTPAEGATVARDEIQLMGWALDADGPIDTLVVLADGDVATVARVRYARPDVAAAHPHVPRAEDTGWLVDVDLTRATGPEVTLTLVGRSAGGWHELDSRTLTVVDKAPKGRRLAVFTIVQNEPRFLPLWLRHFSRHVDPDDLYVLDHDSSDGSVAASGARHVVPLHRTETFDQRWLRDQGAAFQRTLLGSYDAVLYTDVDELVAPDPAVAPTLSAYADRMTAPSVACRGFNVVQHPGEAAFDFDRPVLEQRRWWHPSRLYSKPLLARQPMDWEVGFHGEHSPRPALPDPDLYLLHLHRVDYAYCLARHRASAARRWSQESIDRQWGQQNRVVDDDEFATWFFEGADLDTREREAVPEHLRSLA